jgi:HPt (histidine-containing phosphotransfer) domain-containing protein
MSGSSFHPSKPLTSQFDFDPDMTELIALFVSELPARMGALSNAVKGRQVADLQRLAHQLKGASAGYGYPTIGEAAAKVERELKANQSDAEQAIEAAQNSLNELVDLCRRASAGR